MAKVIKIEILHKIDHGKVFLTQISEITNKVLNYKSLQEKKPYCNDIFCCNKLQIVAINLYCNEKLSLPTIAIKFVAIDYCNKNFIIIEFCCNKIFLLLLKILNCNKKYCCYNLLQNFFCCDRLPQQYG